MNTTIEENASLFVTPDGDLYGLHRSTGGQSEEQFLAALQCRQLFVEQ
ncbi:MAG: hypothetical protein R2932_30815 [Caldilineaceae bacterium]